MFSRRVHHSDRGVLHLSVQYTKRMNQDRAATPSGQKGAPDPWSDAAYLGAGTPTWGAVVEQQAPALLLRVSAPS